MLIICTGPETFLARQKTLDLLEAYKQKHVSQGAEIERLESQTSIQDAITRLSSQGLFAAKRLLKYENLMSGITQAQAKQLIKALLADCNQTVVLTYEDKSPTEKILDLFPKENLFVYAHEKLKGPELNKWISARCNFYRISSDVSSKLIELHNDNLWAIESSLQAIRVLSDTSALEKTTENDDSAFAIIDQFFKNNPNWITQAASQDPQELLPLLLSQLLNWHKIKSDQAQDVHPFVKKKLGSVKLPNAEELTLNAIRTMYASRNSLSQNQEILQLLF
ncbi:MAG: DNA polymerase III subunit delta [Patescibacteria group bacterium]